MNADFLEQLAGQPKVDNNAACRRASEQILAMIKKRYDQSVCEDPIQAELDFPGWMSGGSVRHLFTKGRRGRF
jgi:hypothetical protein